MEKIIEILEGIQPDVDYTTCNNLIDGHFLDSLSILALVAELEDEYDITIPAVEINKNNFNSAEAILMMVNRLSEEE